MPKRDIGRLVLLSVLATGSPLGCERQPTTPEDKRARAEELLRTMSRSLGSARSMTVETTEVSNRVTTGGSKAEELTTRQIAIRRPDGAYFKQTGSQRENEMWYDGKRITLAMHKDKAWARGPMPATLDEALDALATEYGIFVAAADLFYSNPYDSFESSGSTGGWVGRESIEGTTCHHLAFEAKMVDWAIWVADTPQALPCRMTITYKQEPGSPSSMLTFRDWNLAPTLGGDAFAAKVDSSYERLYLVRAPTAEPVDTVAEGPADAPATAQPAPKQ
jgi:hypothetical protein